MKRFAELYDAIDSTTSTNDKVAAMVAYFEAAPPEDAAWATFFLTGQKLKRTLSSKALWEWTLDHTGLPGWILDDCWAEVGDGAEMVALLVAAPDGEVSEDAGGLPLHVWVEERLAPLRDLDPAGQRDRLAAWAPGLDRERWFLVLKMLTGELRVGVSRTLVVRALARVGGVPEPVVEHRLMGAWAPTPDQFLQLLAKDTDDADRSRPYPFYLASAIEGPPESLGERREWLAEWKWDGIRSQVVRRAGEVHVWSRGEELVTERFPEIADAAMLLPDGTVLDGEIMAWDDAAGGPLPFGVLQTRIGRKKLSKRTLEAAPIVVVAYDILEDGGEDVRERPLSERRERLVRVLAASPERFRLSPSVDDPTWEDLAVRRSEARRRRVEGLMLKRLDSPYRTGRRKGDWWKWKIDPFTIDAVLIYAQPGSGKRASLLTDYTFAVWRGDELVPFAKAYSGLENTEIEEIDRWVRRHTVERFGPVRRVEPVHVFELAFEGLWRSTRHKSGVAVRFPRILRWRRDKTPDAANSLEDVWALAEEGSEDAADLRTDERMDDADG